MSLDNDRAARAVLQNRNTPIQNIGLSPAQLLLHHWLRDFMPSHPTLYKPHAEWIAAARNREKSLSRRNAWLIVKYNRTAHTLHPLLKGQIVSIQYTNNGRWSTTGQVTETLPHNQSRIRVDGSEKITLQNRRFLRKLLTLVTPYPILSPSNGTPILEGNDESKAPALQTTDSETAPQPPLPPRQYQPASSDNAGKARSSFILSAPTQQTRIEGTYPPRKTISHGGEGEI